MPSVHPLIKYILSKYTHTDLIYYKSYYNR